MTGPQGGDDRVGDKPFHFTDRRRFDPKTGARRDAGDAPAGGDAPAAGSSPFGPKGPFAPAGAAGDPGDPVNAAQPISAGITTPELEAAQQQVAERTADLQRVTAEYANYRKRVDRDREQVVLTAKASVLTEMLMVLDDIDRAAAHGDLTGAFKSVADKLSGVLTKLGLEQVGAQGDSFDPAQHEAVHFGTSADVAEPTVTDVLRHGYSISGRLVRPAVVVVTGPEHEPEAQTGATESAAADRDPAGSPDSDENAGSESAGTENADAENADSENAGSENADGGDDSAEH